MKIFLSKIKKTFTHNWRKPVIHTAADVEEEKKATWLELFYDLIFVAVVAQLAHKLEAYISFKGVLKYIALFVPVWWVWIASTYYSNRFVVDDAGHKLFVFLKMIPICVFAYSVHDAFGERSVYFALAYASLRIIHVLMWHRADKTNPIFRKVASYFTVGYLTAAALWIASVFVPAPYRYILWAVGMFIDICTPFTTMKMQQKIPNINVVHLPERFGLFVILALGESVIGAANGIAAQHHLTMANSFIGFCGLIIAFSIWWIYFEQVMVNPFGGGLWWGLTWTYLHFPIMLAITAIGAGVQHMVGHHGDFVKALYLMLGSIIVVIGVLAVIDAMSKNRFASSATYLKFFKSRISAVAMLAGLIFLIPFVSATFILVGLIAVLVYQIFSGMYILTNEAA